MKKNWWVGFGATVFVCAVGCSDDKEGDSGDGGNPSGTAGQSTGGGAGLGGTNSAGATSAGAMTGGMAGNVTGGAGGAMAGNAGSGGDGAEGGHDDGGAPTGGTDGAGNGGMAGNVAGGGAGNGGLGGMPGGSGGASAGGGGAPAGSGGAGGSGGASAGNGGAGRGGMAGAAGATSCPPPATGGVFDAHCLGCTRQKIGNPTWEPTDAVVVLADNRSGWNAWIRSVIAPLHYLDTNQNLIVPFETHCGPYTDEAYELITAAGLVPQQTFTTAQYTPPYGIGFFINVVPSPGAPTGISYDYVAGPIIPNARFQMTCNGDAYRNGALYDPVFDSMLPGYNQQNPPIAGDGPSHMLWMLGEDKSFGPTNTPAEGCYELIYTVNDQTGAGWSMSIPFAVTDTTLPGCIPDN